MKSEDIVEQALKELLDEKKITYYLKSKPNFQLDTNGVDFIIFLKGGMALPLQVKRSDIEIPYHFKRYPFVSACITVKGKRINGSVGKTKDAIMRLIRNCLNKSHKHYCASRVWIPSPSSFIP